MFPNPMTPTRMAARLAHGSERQQAERRAPLAPRSVLRNTTSMHLQNTGHPLHSRALSVALTQNDAGQLALESYLLDLRKRGFVPVGGDLQGPGIIHHMRLRGVETISA